MKGRIILGLSALALLATGCQKEIVREDDQEPQGRVFKAVMEQPGNGTKASVTDEGVFSWTDGDKIAVISSSKEEEVSISVNEGVASFSTSSQFLYDATYPSEAAVLTTIEGKLRLGRINFPKLYEGYQGGLNAIMFADISESTDVANFRHLAAVLKVSFKSLPAGIDKFVITTDKNISGLFDIDLTEENPQIEHADAFAYNENTVTFTFAATEANAELVFYIPLPVGEYNGFKVELFAGETSMIVKETSKTYRFARRDLGIFPQLNYSYLIPHEYVDLGLPSGTLWATTNIGAATPYDCGEYFAWGETVARTSGFNEDMYKWEDDNGFTKYNTEDDLIVLQPEDDAATVNWGAPWRTPTPDEFNELCNAAHCSWVWDSERMGYTVTGLKEGYTDRSIFLPCAGEYTYNSLSHYGDGGYYWSSMLSEFSEYLSQCLEFTSENKKVDKKLRNMNGKSIRPVRAK